MCTTNGKKKKIKVLSEFIGKKVLKGIWSKVEVSTSGFVSDRSCEDEFHCCPNNTDCGRQLYSASNPQVAAVEISAPGNICFVILQDKFY